MNKTPKQKLSFWEKTKQLNWGCVAFPYLPSPQLPRDPAIRFKFLRKGVEEEYISPWYFQVQIGSRVFSSRPLRGRLSDGQASDYFGGTPGGTCQMAGVRWQLGLGRFFWLPDFLFPCPPRNFPSPW